MGDQRRPLAASYVAFLHRMHRRQRSHNGTNASENEWKAVQIKDSSFNGA